MSLSECKPKPKPSFYDRGFASDVSSHNIYLAVRMNSKLQKRREKLEEKLKKYSD